MLMIERAAEAWRALMAAFCRLQQIQYSAPWRQSTKC